MTTAQGESSDHACVGIVQVPNMSLENRKASFSALLALMFVPSRCGWDSVGVQKEVADGVVSVRKRKDGDKGSMTVADFLKMTARLCASRPICHAEHRSGIAF